MKDDGSSNQTPSGNAAAAPHLQHRDTLQDGGSLARKNTGHRLAGGMLWLRDRIDEEGEDWWFASTAIPLLAATLGPLANVLSISALVSYWRISLRNPDGGPLLDELDGKNIIPDPKWCYDLNAISLACGFVGNFFLLLNFTNRIRYIIALPVTILLWYFATAILIALTLSMNIYIPPDRPYETYSQAFWSAVLAAVLYMICSMILMVNMLGYFLGHYRQHFNLTESQRTLILQTMMFFVWLGGGAGVFQALENNDEFTYQNALYFCDVTVLTVGFGDIVPTDNAGRGINFPYSVGGIIILGLVISSISKFAAEIGHENVIKKRLNTQRQRTFELTRRKSSVDRRRFSLKRDSISRPAEARRASILSPPFDYPNADDQQSPPTGGVIVRALKRTGTAVADNVQPKRRKTKTARMLIVREEKDRFLAMRRIQENNEKFKQYTALTMSVTVFAIIWCIGAVVFWQTEKNVQDMSYFKALYFCYVSLLTIGYGDFAPKSNAGRPFFIVWSIVAVPSMTILIGHLGDTVISSFKESISKLADFTVLPQHGVWRDFVDRHPWLFLMLQKRAQRKKAEAEEKAAAQRVEDGFQLTGPEAAQGLQAPTIEQLASYNSPNNKPSEHEHARRLAAAIKATAADSRNNSSRKYTYEEWAQFTTLIKFSSRAPHMPALDSEEEEEREAGLINWDWIGEDSPMMTEQTEPEWLLDRLCESMARYARRQEREALQLTQGGAARASEKDARHDHAEAREEEEEEIAPDEDWHL